MSLNEALVEQAVLDWFSHLGYTVLYGPNIAPGEAEAERASYSDVILQDRLRAAIARINPHIPPETVEEVLRKVVLADNPNLIEQNRSIHSMLIGGVPAEYRREDGTNAGDQVRLIDFTDLKNNDWLAVNQFTVTNHKQKRRPDIVVFVNGLPLAVIELKNPTDENATINGAFNQLQTYKADIPNLLAYNEVLVISDGLEARAGTLTSDWERFQPWRTINGDALAPKGTGELETLIPGIFDKQRFLDLLHFFIVYEVDGATIYKKLAAYHQFHAVNKAVATTVEASLPTGDKRAGVIWHTQGSGKSLSMVFYAGMIIHHPKMANPTLVILTDRNDLDDQLFGTFSRCQELLRQTPEQAVDRNHLRTLLKVASGGVIFTTIQMFYPESGTDYEPLSDRHNIVFIVDEAHRSQYGLGAKVIKSRDGSEAHIAYGFAKYMRDALPNASYIGFTGTPIEASDKSTKAIFGDYIDVYDIHQAVEDGATVRIYYEARLVKIEMDEKERATIDPSFEDVTEGKEETEKEKLKSKWGRLEAIVGSDGRIAQVAADIVKHFEHRTESLEGKAMIVCMSRRICVELYKAITKLRPEWHDPQDDRGAIKVVMTGNAAEEQEWQQHIRTSAKQKAMANRFRDPKDPLKLVIVRDMWLTGFDAPCLHTMYLDKPMQGHGLMQAIARVNRVFKDKPGGLVVDYLGLADALKLALAEYTKGDREEAGVPQEQAVAIMLEKFEVVQALFFGFDYSRFFTGTPSERLAVMPAAMEHILTLEDGKKRYLQAVTELSKAFVLAVPHEEAIKRRDEVGFFQAIRAAFVKATPTKGKTHEELDTAVRQIVSKAVAAGEVIDIYATLGVQQPNIALLSDEFLEEVKDLPQRNLALELLRKLLNDQIKVRQKRNVVEARTFGERLDEAVRRYQNHSIEAAQVIAEVIELAKDIRTAQSRGTTLGLSEEELAFYDALGVNDSAVQVLGDQTLKLIAHELVQAIRNSVTIDWTVKESVRAKIRTVIKRLLRKYKYPPDKQEKAVQTIVEQAEVLCRDWAP